MVHRQPSARRDVGTGRRLLLRSAPWGVWLRRPPPVALRATATAVHACLREPALMPAVARALAGWPGVIRARRVVPEDLERRLRLLELHAER